MENPILFTIVIDEPFVSFGAFKATIDENIGESGITTIPQMNKKRRNNPFGKYKIASGEIRQQIKETDRAVKATFLARNFCERYPPAIHAGPPIAMMRKEQSGILNGSDEG